MACAPQPQLCEVAGAIMGTTYSVKVVTPQSLGTDARTALGELVFGALDEVDRLMSTYREDSEISRFNRAPAGVPFALSAPTVEVLLISQQVSAESGGAFDVTVGPLVDAWGFGPDGRPAVPPPEDRLRELAASVGWQRLHLDPHLGTLTKESSATRCDLSAVAKGYAVDRAARALETAGYRDYMVEVGGEVRTGGLNDRRLPWAIAIENPIPGSSPIHRVLRLSGIGLATSGDYRNHYEIDGARYSHTIDPRTSRPLSNPPAAVSVLHESTAFADAYATALMVLGPEAGIALASERNLAAVFLVYQGEGVAEVTSPAFRAYLEAQPTEPSTDAPAPSAAAVRMGVG